ncbi:uncharacterized protein DEA37_0012603 [Paragonimus westermani]|uniref:Uncharacterized protein n=1 Tax=Paragonimus westermani TaxID=34504 RepID=A0A5J4NB14_9TREM|nr:uncharacterized protein DEA37_0012603 [Paragonimus westermani]
MMTIVEFVVIRLKPVAPIARYLEMIAHSYGVSAVTVFICIVSLNG